MTATDTPSQRRGGGPVTLLTYTKTRPRGLSAWRPQRKTRLLLEQVQAVLEEYAEHLPLTCRQIFYRLVGAHGYAKDEQAYGRLTETLNRARGARLVAFDAIRDDGTVARLSTGYEDVSHFWRVIAGAAETYRRDRQRVQARATEVWVEAGGMVPQAERVVGEFGIPVFSSGGFDSLTAKYEAAERVAARLTQQGRPTVVLHVGDWDPSGCAVFDSAAADVTALVADLLDSDAQHLVEFRRIAVTPEQINRYALPTAPAKAKDQRGDWNGGTVQAESLPPDVLAAEIRQAVETVVDRSPYEALLAAERTERAAIAADLARMAGGAG